ncbi:MAG: hypothetical protein L0271_22720 [Gemmatimonadetes bacterium]|nr:hypothetical protein [Gemmatimonadota bacterium]
MRRTVIPIMVGLAASGCGLILENPEPQEARLLIEGESGKQVRLITSTVFVAAVNEQGQTRVQLFQADTTIITLPYQKVYRIDEDHRYFVEAARLNSDLQTVHMQVYVDDRKQFDESGVLIDGFPYRFVYAFNQTITQEIVII